MRKALSLIICIIMTFVFAVSVYAAEPLEYSNGDYGFSLTLTEDYTVIDRSTLSKNKDFIERIGYSVGSFSSKLEQSNIIMYAATADNTHQTQIKRWQSDFSKGVINLAALDSDRLATALETMAKPIIAAGSELIDSSIATVDEVTYLCYTVRVDGKFCYTEYITVANEYCYSLVYYNSSSQFSAEELAERDAFISSMVIEGATGESIWGGYSLALRVISAVLLIAAVVFAVYLVSSFVRDIRHRRNSPEVIPDHIKMKYK